MMAIVGRLGLVMLRNGRLLKINTKNRPTNNLYVRNCYETFKYKFKTQNIWAHTRPANGSAVYDITIWTCVVLGL